MGIKSSKRSESVKKLVRKIFRLRPRPHHGWKKDPWKPEPEHEIRISLLRLPNRGSGNLVQYLPQIRDQGGISSCVGFGIGGNLAATAKMLGVYDAITKYISPWDIYKGALFIEGVNVDQGCYPRDAIDWLEQKACLPEEYWPYEDGTVVFDTRMRSSSLDPDAAKWPLAGDTPLGERKIGRVRVTGGVEGICSAIDAGHFVSLGSPWPRKKWNNSSDGELVEVTASDFGADGHMYCAYDYDLTLQRVYCFNSWGINWGNGGLFSIPFSAFDVFKQLGGYDAYYFLVNWGTTPPPLPVINSFTASPETINQGEQTTLSWDVSGATTIDLQPDVGAVGAAGSVQLSPASSITYTLTATNEAGWVLSQITVTVIVPIPTPQLRARLQASIDGGQAWSTLFDIGFGFLSRAIRKKKGLLGHK